MNLRLFDLHCDTLYECNKQNKSLVSNDLNLSLKRLSEYKRFCQVLAMWSDPKDSEDENYRNFFMARELLARQLSEAEKLGISVRLCTDSHTLAEAEDQGSMAVMLAVEGGRLLSDDISRLDSLYEAGVRFLTLVWNKTCKIGGAHDSDEGLTDFGREVVLRCFELGIIPDVSHASAKMTSEVLEMCEEIRQGMRRDSLELVCGVQSPPQSRRRELPSYIQARRHSRRQPRADAPDKRRQVYNRRHRRSH